MYQKNEKKDIESHLEQANCFLDKGEYRSALGKYQQIYSKNKNDKILENIVDCYSNLNDYKKGLSFAKELVKRNPSSPEYWLKLSDFYFYIGEFGLCDSCLNECLKYKVSSEIVSKKLSCLEKSENYDEIIALYNKLYSHERKNENLELNLNDYFIFARSFYENGLKNYDNFDGKNAHINLESANKIFDFLFENNYGDKKFLSKYLDLLIFVGEYKNALQICTRYFILTEDDYFNEVSNKIKRLAGIKISFKVENRKNDISKKKKPVAKYKKTDLFEQLKQENEDPDRREKEIKKFVEDIKVIAQKSKEDYKRKLEDLKYKRGSYSTYRSNYNFSNSAKECFQSQAATFKSYFRDIGALFN